MALARGLRACVVVVIASASFALAQTNQQVCTAFVPAAGMDHTSNLNTSTNALLIGIPNPDTVAQQCGATWLVDRLRRFNATVFADYISQSNNDLAPVLDLVCTLPGGSCTQCTQAYAQMYAFLTTPAQPVSVYNFQNSTFFKLAQNIGYACGTTRNPYQVFHPSASTNTACNVCARAFTNQAACSNTAANQQYGLSWWPFYPQAPNSHYPGDVGKAAATWSVSTVCSCFSQSLPATLGPEQLNDQGTCLWVWYQSDPPLTWSFGVNPITSTL